MARLKNCNQGADARSGQDNGQQNALFQGKCESNAKVKFHIKHHQLSPSRSMLWRCSDLRNSFLLQQFVYHTISAQGNFCYFELVSNAGRRITASNKLHHLPQWWHHDHLDNQQTIWYLHIPDICHFFPTCMYLQWIGINMGYASNPRLRRKIACMSLLPPTYFLLSFIWGVIFVLFSTFWAGTVCNNLDGSPKYNLREGNE